MSGRPVGSRTKKINPVCAFTGERIPEGLLQPKQEIEFAMGESNRIPIKRAGFTCRRLRPIPPDLMDVLRYLFIYNPDTGKITRRVKYNKSGPPGSEVGSMNTSGYLVTTIRRETYSLHRIAWAMHHGSWPEYFIDHANGLRADNRIANLRLSTRSQNAHNKPVSKRNKSGIKGVCWGKQNKKWHAKITVEGKQIHLGFYETPEAAHEVWKEKAHELLGEFAKAHPL